MLNSRRLVQALLLSVVVFTGQIVATSCNENASVEEMKIYAAEAVSNAYYKGLFEGASVVVVLLNVYFLIRQRRFVLAAVFALAVLLIQPIFGFAEIMASGCGGSGIEARYYGYQFGAVLMVLAVLIVFRNWRWNKDLQRIPLP